MIEKKVCSKCGKEKLLGEFYLRRESKDNLQGQCKKCKNEQAREWVRSNSEKNREQARKWRKENRFRMVLTYSRNAAKREEYFPCDATVEEIRVAFTGKCHNCEVPEVECNQHLHLDHDHNCKIDNFRGWLCNNCNCGAGNLKDSPELMRKLAEYIERSQAKVH